MARGPLWYQAFEARPDARVRLYCLPCAGGGASTYRPWMPFVPDWVELRAVRLPGRQARHREPAFEDCETAAQAVAEWLSAEEGPYALFGHSMGAMLAYRATRILQAEGAALPALLAAASWPVHGVPHVTMPDPDDDDDAFCAKAAGLAGPATDLLDDPDVRALVLPVMRADFRLCRSYVYREEAPLPVPVSVFGGDDDPVTPAETLSDWKEHGEPVLGPRLFRGGHFFLQEHVGDLTAAVMTDLADVLGPNTGGRRAVG
ncbi:thioesterase II family protein [Amycolatopsis japonica]|uniref:thioesterase II family protein n=1 Tax=Amycolatopsis japonica TaxID=208439 RepID=UPI0037FC843E